jgi:hypothetical protein
MLANIQSKNLVSSCLLSKNINILICKNIILLLSLCGCENWFLNLREGDRLKKIEKRVFSRIFGPNRNEVSVSGENCIKRRLIIYALHQA